MTRRPNRKDRRMQRRVGQNRECLPSRQALDPRIREFIVGQLYPTGPVVPLPADPKARAAAVMDRISRGWRKLEAQATHAGWGKQIQEVMAMTILQSELRNQHIQYPEGDYENSLAFRLGWHLLEYHDALTNDHLVESALNACREAFCDAMQQVTGGQRQAFYKLGETNIHVYRPSMMDELIDATKPVVERLAEELRDRWTDIAVRVSPDHVLEAHVAAIMAFLDCFGSDPCTERLKILVRYRDVQNRLMAAPDGKEGVRVDLGDGWREEFLDVWQAVTGEPRPVNIMLWMGTGIPPLLRPGCNLTDADHQRLQEHMSKLAGDPVKITRGPEAKRYTAEMRAAFESLQDWILNTPQFVLQSNDTSRCHNLKEAIRTGHAWSITPEDAGNGPQVPASNEQLQSGHVRLLPVLESFLEQLKDHQVMVVRHDWSQVFGDSIRKAMEKDGVIRLPYPKVLFEFRISGRTVMVSVIQSSCLREAQQLPSNGDRVVSAFCQHPGSDDWIAFGPDGRIGEFLMDQIDAICVALDAGVATHEVQRAPAALNAKRIKAGKVPLSDFHVVDLSKRNRAAPAPRLPGEPSHGVRLHWRRGHWRHYENHRTWINWMLVGNPDLGFVDKEYRL